ncbi:MAG: hypothetical protein GF353_21475 [Candidatus Lokiarchaeota archaeon]|nr:hypothetical protein [Candidatus Lokiarchaeota archaeon]
MSQRKKNQKKKSQTEKKVEYISAQGGLCVCPVCGTTSTDSQDKPCFQQICPKCGSSMINE